MKQESIPQEVREWLDSVKFEPGKVGSLSNIMLIFLGMKDGKMAELVPSYVKDWWNTNDAEKQLARYYLSYETNTTYGFTTHGRERLEARLGIPYDEQNLYLDKVINDGVTQHEISGNLYRYVQSEVLKYDNTSHNEGIIYKHSLFIFSSTKRLITCYDVPTSLYDSADLYQMNKANQKLILDLDERNYMKQS